MAITNDEWKKLSGVVKKVVKEEVSASEERVLKKTENLIKSSEGKLLEEIESSEKNILGEVVSLLKIKFSPR